MEAKVLHYMYPTMLIAKWKKYIPFYELKPLSELFYIIILPTSVPGLLGKEINRCQYLCIDYQDRQKCGFLLVILNLKN